MQLTLSEISDCFPKNWFFAPSPFFDFISPVARELAELEVASPSDRHFAGFAGVPRYFHPRADRDALVLSLELISWYFYFDDPFDDGDVGRDGGNQAVSRMLRVLEDGDLPDDATPTERLARLFRERALRMAGIHIAPWERFIADLAAWVRSIIPINRRLRSGEPLGLEEYTQLRLINVGIVPEFALNEIIAGLKLDESFLRRDKVKRLGELAALAIAYSNDIYSYERESRQATQMNSLEIRRTADNLTLAEAYASQVQDIHKMVEEMVGIEGQLASAGLVGLSSIDENAGVAHRRREQTRYVEDIRAIVIGNHVWSLSDGRYHSKTSPFQELRENQLRPPSYDWWSEAARARAHVGKTSL